VQRHAGTVETLRFPNCRPGPALGVFEESVYPLCQCALAPHDLIVLFTDGLYEVEGADGDEYGQERLLAAVRKRVSLPAGQLFDELLADVQHYASNRGFVDDVCIVGVEVGRVGLVEGNRAAA
jgi:sigma-B regulation protein RsbU (phosphoserine phosphatase)